MLRNSTIRVHWKFATFVAIEYLRFISMRYKIYIFFFLFFNRFILFLLLFFGFSRYFLIEMNFDLVIVAITVSTLLNRLRGSKCCSYFVTIMTIEFRVVLSRLEIVEIVVIFIKFDKWDSMFHKSSNN